MECEIIKKNDLLIVKVSGQLDMINVSRFREATDRILEEDGAPGMPILVDLSDVYIIDSTGIGALINMQNKCKKINCEMAIIHLPRSFEKLFKLTLIDRFFNMYANEDEARESLFGPANGH